MKTRSWRGYYMRIFRNVAGTLERWRSDLRGAAAVQFIAILPVFILVVIGLWAIFSVYSARDAICDAAREATRYLQVEGPLYPEDEFIYPEDWEAQARDVVQSELQKEQWYDLVPVDLSEVYIHPREKPRSPKDMSEVLPENVSQSWFFVRVTKQITNPIAIFLPNSDEGEEPSGMINVSCQVSAFFEGPPIGPTGIAPPQPPGDQHCPEPPQMCPPGGPPPPSTPCPFPPCLPTPCPCDP